MDNDRNAKAAIDELNETTIDGQEVKVELAKPSSRGGGGAQGQNNQAGGGQNKTAAMIFTVIQGTFQYNKS